MVTLSIVPTEDVRDELHEYWDNSNVPEPKMIIVNDSETIITMDLMNGAGDHLVIRAGFPAETESPIGNHTYGNREYNVIIDAWTMMDSKQQGGRNRLYALAAEVRRICHARRHNMTNFQRIQYVDFEEIDQERNENVWAGQINIRLENRAILLETT